MRHLRWIGKPRSKNGNNGTSIADDEKKAAIRGLATDDIDLFRDAITGMIFADPVFCDRGHTHERSCMERHFQARREMQAEQATRAPSTGGSCTAGTSFQPTCPYTNEPISDVLISNQQCDRLVVALLASGVIDVTSEELENWNSRREEKAKAAVAQSTSDAESNHEVASEILSLPTSVHANTMEREVAADVLSPPTAVNAYTVEIVGEPLILDSPDRVSLGLAVALCPSSFPRHETIWGSRCSNLCCQSLLTTHMNRHYCGRCARVHCASCVPFEVIEYDPNRLERSHAMICSDCVFQLVDVLSQHETSTAISRVTVSRLAHVLTSFFEMVSRNQIQLQYAVLHYSTHRAFFNVYEKMAADFEALQQREALLQEQIRKSRRQPERLNLKSVDNSINNGTATSTTLNDGYFEVMELNAAKRSQWMSIRKHAFNAEIERASTLNSLSKKEIACQARLAAIKAQHDYLEQQGPSDANDLGYYLRLSELTNDFEMLSQQGLQLKRQQKLKVSVLDSKPHGVRAEHVTPVESESERPLRCSKPERRFQEQRLAPFDEIEWVQMLPMGSAQLVGRDSEASIEESHTVEVSTRQRPNQDGVGAEYLTAVELESNRLFLSSFVEDEMPERGTFDVLPMGSGQRVDWEPNLASIEESWTMEGSTLQRPIQYAVRTEALTSVEPESERQLRGSKPERRLYAVQKPASIEESHTVEASTHQRPNQYGVGAEYLTAVELDSKHLFLSSFVEDEMPEWGTFDVLPMGSGHRVSWEPNLASIEESSWTFEGPTHQRPIQYAVRTEALTSVEPESERRLRGSKPERRIYAVQNPSIEESHAMKGSTHQRSNQAATETENHAAESASISPSNWDRCYPSSLGVLAEKPSLTTQTVVEAESTLEALRRAQFTDSPRLPLGLSYPSIQMSDKIMSLRNRLELALTETRSTLDARYSGYEDDFQKLIDTIQDEIHALERERLDTIAAAELEANVQDERRARHRRAHDHHLKMEQERLAAEQAYREERERIETARFQQELKTRYKLRGLELRRCGRCGFGPFEKFDCNDMSAHNDVFFWMDANGVRQRRRRNECPQCKWTHSDWNEWPRFDV